MKIEIYDRLAEIQPETQETFWSLKDREGRVMYEGQAPSQAEFLQGLVADGKSLANADLSGWNLRRTNLRGANLTKANLSDANLGGADLSGSSLKGSILDRANAAGATLHDAQMQGSSIKKATFNNVEMRRANLRGSTLDDTDFSNADMQKSVLTFCTSRRAQFTKAMMQDVDFGRALLVRNDFKGANLNSLADLKIEHQPDRTRNTRIIGCMYDKKTKMGEGNIVGFRKDRWRSSFANGSFLAIAGAATFGASYLIDQVAPGLSPSNLLMTGVGCPIIGRVAICSALVFLRGHAEDGAKKYLQDALDKFTQKSREFTSSTINKMRNLKNIFVAWGDEKSMAPLRRALTATRRKAGKTGLYSDFRYLLSENMGAFILCDREHLAMALGALSSNRERGYLLSQDILLLRQLGQGQDEEFAPSAIRFHKNGETTLVWSRDGQPSQSFQYDAEGNLMKRYDWEKKQSFTDMGGVANAECLSKAISSFKEQILEDAGIEGFQYPEEDHYLHYGRDGSILVYDSATRRVDNPIGPALVTPDNMGVFYRHGRRVEDIEPIPMTEMERFMRGTLLPEQRESFNAPYMRNSSSKRGEMEEGRQHEESSPFEERAFAM